MATASSVGVGLAAWFVFTHGSRINNAFSAGPVNVIAQTVARYIFYIWVERDKRGWKTLSEDVSNTWRSNTGSLEGESRAFNNIPVFPLYRGLFLAVTRFHWKGVICLVVYWSNTILTQSICTFLSEIFQIDCGKTKFSTNLMSLYLGFIINM